MSDPRTHAFGVYGLPPADLVEIPPGATQYSPLMPGVASELADVAEGALAGMAMLAAPGTIERRHDLAAMLRALAPGAPFTVLAQKDMGGARLAKELAAFECAVDDRAKRHHRICVGTRPPTIAGLTEAITDGAPRYLDEIGLWSQPGIFSWNRIDPASTLLLDALSKLAGRGADVLAGRRADLLAGRGADFGCGIGVLAHGVLASPKVTRLALIDIDRRAIAAARRNVDDPRVSFAWADLKVGTGLEKLDFVVMNPPFHAGGTEDKSLGQTFIRRAAEALRTGGHLWLTANRHLPYEAVLKPLFRRVEPVIEAQGFKVVTAQK